MSYEIKDLAGLGEIVGHIKELILKLIEVWATRDEGKLKKQRMRLENAREFLELSEKYRLTPERLNEYITLANDSSATFVNQAGLNVDHTVNIRRMSKELPSIEDHRRIGQIPQK
jgi:hypothetical protein